MEHFNRPVVCYSCKTDLERVFGELKFEEDGLTITVGNVPLLRCAGCDAEFVPGPIAEELSEIVTDIAAELKDAPLVCTDVNTTYADRREVEQIALRA